jgi:hypothetical protein
VRPNGHEAAPPVSTRESAGCTGQSFGSIAGEPQGGLASDPLSQAVRARVQPALPAVSAPNLPLGHPLQYGRLLHRPHYGGNAVRAEAYAGGPEASTAAWAHRRNGAGEV